MITKINLKNWYGKTLNATTCSAEKANEIIERVNELDAAEQSEVGDPSELVPVVRTNNPAVAADTIYENLDHLDGAIGADNVPAVRINSPTVANTTLNAKVQALDTAIGTDAQIVSFSNIAKANSINSNLSVLDLAVYFLQQTATFNSTSASINAAGANQGNGTPVATGIAVVALADGTTCVVLPAVSTTKVITLFNIVANQDLVVFPAVGEYVNAAAQNASLKFKHATLTSSVVCTYQSAGKWTVTAIVGTIS